MGIRQHADKRWLAMRGDDASDQDPPIFGQAPTTFPDTSELQLDLSVVRKGTVLTLGGVIFLPVITGMVVPDSGTSFGI